MDDRYGQLGGRGGGQEVRVDEATKARAATHVQKGGEQGLVIAEELENYRLVVWKSRVGLRGRKKEEEGGGQDDEEGEEGEEGELEEGQGGVGGVGGS